MKAVGLPDPGQLAVGEGDGLGEAVALDEAEAEALDEADVEAELEALEDGVVTGASNESVGSGASDGAGPAGKCVAMTEPTRMRISARAATSAKAAETRSSTWTRSA